MRIGNGRKCISPLKKEFYLIGYKTPFRNQPSKGIHDDIFCNGLLMEIGNQRLFIASFDFLELEAEMVNEAKELLAENFGLDRELILLTATHNHSSIMSYHKNWHSGIFDQEYYDYVLNQLTAVYEACDSSLQEAAVKTGSKIITGYYGNRNHPGEPADNEVIVIDFCNNQGVTVGTIVNLAVHSTVLSPKNNYLTGELAGQLCSKLHEAWGIFPLMMIGAAADASNRHERLGDDFAELERVTSALAGEIAAIERKQSLKLDQLNWQTLSHTVYNDMIQTHQEAERFIVSDSPLKNPGLIKKCEDILRQKNYTLQLEFNVFQLGDLQLFVFPGELGSAFGIDLKEFSRQCGREAIVSGYTNGFYHYFMPEKEYGLSFETIANPVPAGEPEKIIEKMKQSAQLLDSYYE